MVFTESGGRFFVMGEGVEQERGRENGSFPAEEGSSEGALRKPWVS